MIQAVVHSKETQHNQVLYSNFKIKIKSKKKRNENTKSNLRLNYSMKKLTRKDYILLNSNYMTF